MDDPQTQLMDMITAETQGLVTPSVQKLAAAIQKCGDVRAILFYGSGLWKEEKPDTLYDFYVLVDTFQDFNINTFPAALGRVLPPNVYYMELKEGGQTLRCKYAVIRLDQFEDAAKGGHYTPQIWARFAQPCRLVFSCNETTKNRIYTALRDCVLTFHRRAFALTPSGSNARDVWLKGLSATYGAELRSEKPERTAQIFDANKEAFARRTELSSKILSNIKRDQIKAHIFLKLSRPFQKSITFLRLMKATITFEGGVDYALWKIERQSGIKAEATDFQRRYPLLGIWPLVWRLWRKGAFR